MLFVQILAFLYMNSTYMSCSQRACLPQRDTVWCLLCSGHCMRSTVDKQVSDTVNLCHKPLKAQWGQIGVISPSRISLFGIFRGIIKSGRHPRGFPDPVGSILLEYHLKRSHMDLIRTRFHDLFTKLPLCLAWKGGGTVLAATRR